MDRLRKIDVFPKFDARFEKDAREKTPIGALLSVAAVLLMLFLAISEVRFYFTTEIRRELFVDPNVDGQLSIFINVSFPAVPCDLMTVDAVDFFGSFQDAMVKKTVKHRLDANMNIIAPAAKLVAEVNKDGKHTKKDEKSGAANKEGGGGGGSSSCGSCYGSETFQGDCCNTCEDVRSHYERRGWHLNTNDVSITQCAQDRLEEAAMLAHHEGCNIYAHLDVARVQGNIHYIPGREILMNGMHLHDIGGEVVRNLNLSHIIHELRFDDSASTTSSFSSLSSSSSSFSSSNSLLHQSLNNVNPLSNNRRKIITHGSGNGKFQYFVKVVPTQYDLTSSTATAAGISGGTVETYQYSATEDFFERPSDNNNNNNGGNNNGNGGGGMNDPQQQMNYIPGIFINYEFSPIKVRVFETGPYTSFVHLLLQLCAVCGGTFTVASLADAALHHGVRRARHKMAIGKLS